MICQYNSIFDTIINTSKKRTIMKKMTLLFIAIAIIAIAKAQTMSADKSFVETGNDTMDECAKYLQTLSWLDLMYKSAADLEERKFVRRSIQNYLYKTASQDPSFLLFSPYRNDLDIRSNHYEISEIRKDCELDSTLLKNLIAVSSIITDSFHKYKTQNFSDAYFYYPGGSLFISEGLNYNLWCMMDNPAIHWVYDPTKKQVFWIEIYIPESYEYIWPQQYWEGPLYTSIYMLRKKIEQRGFSSVSPDKAN